MTAGQKMSPLVLAPGNEAGDYQAGVCNIGPSEIARRRMVGHLAAAFTVLLLVVMVLLHVPAWSRIVLMLPASVSASGYIQARFHFCAGFGSRGVYNFGAVGPETYVAGAEDRARDRARARQIGIASFAIGLAIGVIAALLPL